MPIPLANSDLSRGRFEAAPAPLPDVGFVEGIASTYRAQAADHVGAQYDNQVEAYGPLVDALIQQGHRADDYQVPFAIQANAGYASRPVYLWDQVWADAKKAGIAGLPGTQAEFDKAWQAKANARVAQAQATAARAGWAPWLVGGLGAGLTDETNLYALGAGGFGETAFKKIASEALVNGLLASAQNPLINAGRRQQGRPEMTFGEEAANVGLAAGVGGLIRSGIETPGIVARAVDNNWNLLPSPLRERWQAARLSGAAEDWRRLADSDPALLADVTVAIVGRPNLSQAEAAFADQLNRAAMHDAASPFRGDGAGTELHDRLMSDALGEALSEHPEATTTRLTPAAAAPIEAAAIPGSEQRFIDKVFGAESGGAANPDLARNPNSSASGRGQFTDGTWLAYYKRRFGGNLSDAQILARKSDPATQRTLMGDLTHDNAAALRRAGIPASEGNLYLAHFAGPEGARKVLEADPGTPLDGLLGAKAIEANPFLRGKTAGWLSEWANRKMGSSAGGGARLGDGFAGGDTEAARIQDALDAAKGREAQLAEVERQARQAQGLPDLGEASPGPEPMDLTPELAPVAREHPADLHETVPGPLLEDLRRVASDGGRSLNQVDKLADELGASPEAVRRGLTSLAQGGELRFVQRFADRERVKNGKGRWRTKTPQEIAAENGGMWRGEFARPVRASGPDDMLRFIARNGGLEPNGLGATEVARIERDGGTVKGHDLRNTGHLDKLVAGVGPLLRPKGLGLDAMIERLHDAGYFGPPGVTPRPDEGEFITLLDDTIRKGEKRYSSYDTAPEERPAASPSDDEAQRAEDEARWAAEEAATGLWMHVSDAAEERYRAVLLEGDTQELMALMRQGTDLLPPVEPSTKLTDDEIAPYVGEWLNRKIDEALDDAWLETEDVLYGDQSLLGDEADPAAARGAGPAAEPGNAREGAPGGRAGGPTGAGAGQGAPPDVALAELPPEARSPYADPEGPAIEAQADSLEHDARLALDLPDAADPNNAAVARQENDLAAQQPLRGERKTGAAQDATMPEGLFGGPEAPDFRFDVEGATRSLKDALDSIDTEAAELKTIKDCL